jgi:hypothetical protein
MSIDRPGCSFQLTPRRRKGLRLKVRRRKARYVANQWRKSQWWKDQWRNGHWLEGRVWKARRLARRRIIAEEIKWREAHVANAAESKKLDFLPAPDIAEIYRDLRKGLEEERTRRRRLLLRRNGDAPTRCTRTHRR